MAGTQTAIAKLTIKSGFIKFIKLPIDLFRDCSKVKKISSVVTIFWHSLTKRVPVLAIPTKKSYKIRVNFWLRNGRRSTRWGLLLLLAALAGCGRDDIQVYRIAKEQPSAPEAKANMPETSQDEAAAPHIQWKLPLGWQERPASSMRVASFTI